MDEATLTAEEAAEDAAEQAARPGSSTTRAIARAGLIVTVLFLVSRVLGYVRTIVVAAAFPADGQLAPFFTAFRIPDFLFQLVAAGALSSALIPIIASLLAKDEEARAWRVVSTVTTLMLSLLAALVALAMLFAPQLVDVMAPGFEGEMLAETTSLTRIMMLSPLFLAIGSVLTSVLNSRGRFAAAALAPLAYNLGIIGGAVFLADSMGLAGLAVGVVVGAVGHMLVQAPSVVRLGARLRPRLDLSDDQARLALLLMAPRALGLGATQIVFLVITSLATTLGAQAVVVFNFSFALLQIPIGVIGVPLGVVLLPSLSREAADGATEGFTRLMVRGLAILAFVMIGIAGLGIVVSEDLVRILFGISGISENAIEGTGLALAVFLVGLTAHALITVLARAFYALKDTRTPVAAALGAVAANILLANLLIGPLGLNGLALAIALSAWLETVALVAFLRGRVPGYGAGLRYVLGVVARTLVVTLAGAAVGYGIELALVAAWGEDPGFLLLVVRSGLAVAAGGVVIIAGALALRIAELRTIVGVVVDLISRRGRA
jgi:putative peptidoglycan lipid II flippase